jgi:hypothetical protein
MSGETTERECIEALRRAARELGRSPSKSEYEDLGLTPASATIIRNVGGWNRAKQRAGLETNASRGSRTVAPPEDVPAEVADQWSDLSVDQRWHYRNPEWNKKRTLNRRSRLRSWLNDRKAETGCERCGEADPSCLDFHHVDAEDKEMDVSTLVTFGHSKDRLREEIRDCEVICANCHWREHHSRQSWMARHDADDLSDPVSGDVPTPDDVESFGWASLNKEKRQRAWTYAYKRHRGCSKCTVSDPVCLQFHHESDNKHAGVGSMIANSRSTDDLLREIRKCRVLCANCHRKTHEAT